MDKIETFVIHYTKLVDRKANLLDQYDKTLFDLNFVEEFDAESLSDDLLKEFYDKSYEKFNKKVEIWKSNKASYYVMNKAEISCTIKHIKALQYVAKSKEPYSLIIEDDAIPINNRKFYKQFFKLSEQQDWDAIFFGQGMGKDFIKKNTIEKTFFRKKFVQIEHPATNCLEAYVIKKDAATKILTNILPFNLVSDWEIAYQFYKFNMNIFWYLPPLFFQGSKNGQYKSTLR